MKIFNDYIHNVSFFDLCWASLLYFITTLILFSENEYLLLISILLIPFTWILKIVSIINSFKNFKNIDISEPGFKSDRVARGKTYIYISVLTLILGFITFKYLGYNYFSNFHTISFFCFIICLFFSGLAIIKNSYIFRFCCIISVTFLGLFTLLLVVVSLFSLFSLLLSFLPLEASNSNQKFFTELYNLFSPKTLIILSYVVENHTYEFITLSIYSTVFLCITVLIHPAYQLEQLSTAFKISNITLTLSSLAIFFFVSISFTPISLLNELKNLEYYKDTDIAVIQNNFSNFKTYLSNFSKANIISVGTIFFAPYVVGILITSFLLDLRLKQTKKVSANILEKSMVLDLSYKNEHFMTKKYFYYNGDKNLWKMHNDLNTLKRNNLNKSSTKKDIF
ncbi:MULTISPECIES: hypothetical protein [Bacillus]|uniref:hypothetical protein n=1 Tax=Bacillus TaxID=1386 RepID=UPI000CCC7405|nr:hypothetical protein [Bacillus safensis]MCR6473604.1 hypothetical protein [Bacillus safensis]PNU22796.1 hypothetical protein C1954_13510 [Bacillus stratosphericus]UIN50696.1 hypothetical protein LXN49_02320 [Bacillus safensis]